MEENIKKVITSTGKVHLAYTGMWKNGDVEPLCNYMSWRGDCWGKPWKILEDQSTPVTCKNCLKTYWPDGRKRLPKTPKDIAEVTVDELIEDIKEEKPRGDGAVIIASSPSKRFVILSIYTDDNKNLCIDVEGV